VTAESGGRDAAGPFRSEHRLGSQPLGSLVALIEQTAGVDVAVVDEATKEGWRQVTTPTSAARFGWIDQYRALQTESNRTLAPQRLLARATQGYLEEVVSIQTLARLRGDSQRRRGRSRADRGRIRPTAATTGVGETRRVAGSRGRSLRPGRSVGSRRRVSHRPIIDAGPALNSFAANQERLLIEVLGALSIPETVHAEVLRKARVDRRFRPARSVMARLTRR